MPNYCCVPGCTNKRGHLFSTSEEMQMRWQIAINRGDRSEKFLWQPMSYINTGVRYCAKSGSQIEQSSRHCQVSHFNVTVNGGSEHYEQFWSSFVVSGLNRGFGVVLYRLLA